MDTDTITFTISETALGYEVTTKHLRFADKWKFRKVSKLQLFDLMLGLTQKFNNEYHMAVLFEVD